MDDKHPIQESNEIQKASNPETGATPAVVSRRAFSKRWLYPAIYLGAAALIIGIMYVKSHGGSTPTTGNVSDTGPNSTPVTVAPATESFIWPVAQGVKPEVTLGFFPIHGTKAQQAKALVLYNNGWYAHNGVDIKAQDSKDFSVTAALGGKVTNVTNNQLYGTIVEVTSPNGYVERYESLSKADVQKGDTVQQGQPLGSTGKNLFEASQGEHLYLEVSKDGQTVDPQTLLPKN